MKSHYFELTLTRLYFLFLCNFLAITGLNNGLARLPPMGWMSWGYYECNVDCKKNPQKCLNEDLIITVANEFYNSGYQEAGYEYIVIDDCWSEKVRDGDGRLVPDRVRFPKGIKYLADYVHKLGLKLGIYGNVAKVTCMGYPGSKDHFRVDAETFAEWEVDYVKFDGCFVPEKDLNKVYKEFSIHLNRTGRPIVFSCSWPYYIEYIHGKMPDYEEIAKYCNLWRNYHDIFLKWPSVAGVVAHFETEHERMATYLGPGRWNDPDMIVVGNGVLTEGQSRIQMAVWAMLSAPLLITCDMLKVLPFEKKLLQNPYVISVNQDPLAIQGVPYKKDQNGCTVWVKKQLPKKADLINSYSIAVVNMGPKDNSIQFTLKELSVDHSDGYTMMDLFQGVFLKNVTINESLKFSVPPEDVKFYKFFPL